MCTPHISCVGAAGNVEGHTVKLLRSEGAGGPGAKNKVDYRRNVYGMLLRVREPKAHAEQQQRSNNVDSLHNSSF